MVDAHQEDMLGLTAAERARVEALIRSLHRSRATLGRVAAVVLSALPPDSVRDRDVEDLAAYVESLWRRVVGGG